MVTVSVIIPTCNAGSMISTSLMSVLRQTHVDFEVIIVDDASTDRTCQLVQGYVAKKKSREIRLVTLSKRVGACVARNIGCEQATGDYLAFLDQDDMWIPEKLRLQVDYLYQNQECAMVIGDLEAIDSTGYRLNFTTNEDFRHPPSWEDMLLLYPAYPTSCLLRRQIFHEVGGYDTLFVMSGAYGDQELNLRIREKSLIAFINKVVGFYRWDIERPSRIESFLLNLPIYARICWDRREGTPLRDSDLQRKFVSVCHAQYLYYADLLLGRFYRQLKDHQLCLIAQPRSSLVEIFGEFYSKLTGMMPVSLPDTVQSHAMRLLLAIFLLRPDLQRQYPEALNGEFGRLLEWAVNVSHVGISDKYARMLHCFRREYARESRSLGSCSTDDFETWLHRPDWPLVRKLAGAAAEIAETPDDPTASRLPAFLEASEPIKVSIIIPSYDKVGYLLNCLNSVAANTRSFGDCYEVIVVDNGSNDPKFEIVSGIANIRMVRLGSNKGFVEACNVGADMARGEYVVFLNNDVIVTPSWLNALVNIAETDSEIGAVGAKLVYPSGQLQEAGCIVWSNGMAHNYGRGDSPSKPEYNYRREVDYCSAACLLVRRDLFIRVGGFDRLYSPGYYEDSDLCFSIRKEGKKVIYQPRSVIIHFEGVTGGRDVRFGIKRYQVINHKKFVAKWANELKHQPTPGQLLKGRERGAGRSILIVERRIPEPDKNSGDSRLQHILKILKSERWQVTVFADDNLLRDPYVTDFRDSGIEIIYEQSLDRILGQRANFYDIIWLARPRIGFKYVDLVRKLSPESKVVFDMTDLASLRERRWAELTGDKSLLRMSEETKAQELYVAQRSDLTIAISEREKALMLRRDGTLRVEVITNVHVVGPITKSFEDRRNLLFLGGFEHAPNVDSLLYFVHEILDRIRRKQPEVKLVVIGSDMPAKVKNLRHEGVDIVGYVNDVKPYFDSCKVFVAPIRFGAGIKGKIGLSMALGLPVVTTSLGAEGMGLEHGRNVLISDDPWQFANHVVALYTDKRLWYRVSRNGQKHVSLRYNPKTVQRRLLRIVRQLIDEKYGDLSEAVWSAPVDALHEELAQRRRGLSSTFAELKTIPGSLTYRVLRFFASNIDAGLPRGTRRGEFRKILVAGLRIISNEGWRSFWRQMLEKIRRREIYIRSA